MKYVLFDYIFEDLIFIYVQVLGSLYDSAVDLALNSDFAMAVKCAFHLIMTTKNALYEKFAVTESIRNKILKILPMIRIKADKALSELIVSKTRYILMLYIPLYPFLRRSTELSTIRSKPIWKYS